MIPRQVSIFNESVKVKVLSGFFTGLSVKKLPLSVKMDHVIRIFPHFSNYHPFEKTFFKNDE